MSKSSSLLLASVVATAVGAVLVVLGLNAGSTPMLASSVAAEVVAAAILLMGASSKRQEVAEEEADEIDALVSRLKEENSLLRASQSGTGKNLAKRKAVVATVAREVRLRERLGSLREENAQAIGEYLMEQQERSARRYLWFGILGGASLSIPIGIAINLLTK